MTKMTNIYTHAFFTLDWCSAIAKGDSANCRLIRYSTSPFLRMCNLDRSNGIAWVDLRYGSSIDLRTRFERNPLHLVVHTDYVVTVHFDPAVVSFSTLLDSLKQQLNQFEQDHYSLSICYQTENEFAVLVQWELTEHWQQSFTESANVHTMQITQPPINFKYLYRISNCVASVARDSYMQSLLNSAYYLSVIQSAPQPGGQTKSDNIQLDQYVRVTEISRSEECLNMLAVRAWAYQKATFSTLRARQVIYEHINRTFVESTYASVENWVTSMNQQFSTYNAAFFASHFDTLNWSDHVGSKFHFAYHRHLRDRTGISLNNEYIYEIDHVLWVEKHFYFPYSPSFDINVLKDLMSKLTWGQNAFMRYNIVKVCPAQRKDQLQIKVTYSAAIDEGDFSYRVLTHWKTYLKKHSNTLDVITDTVNKIMAEYQKWHSNWGISRQGGPIQAKINKHFTAKAQKWQDFGGSVSRILKLECIQHYCGDVLTQRVCDSV